MKRAIKCSKYTSWHDAYQEINKIVDDNFPKIGRPGFTEDTISDLVDEWYESRKGDPAVDEAYRRWSEPANDGTETSSREILYVIKDRNGNQLSAPNADDNALWDRVESMEARGRRGLSVVVYQPE